MDNKYIKYIDETTSASAIEHWEYCKQFHLPYISVKYIGKNKKEIFYDVTELNIDLEYISEQVKDLFRVYRKFFLLNEYFGTEYEDNFYFFSFPVRVQHSDCIANGLFDFLMTFINL